MLGCRNIIRDLAGHLWRDPRDTYIYLSGSGKDGKLPVTEDKYVNRLGAYLHQKAVVGDTGDYLRAEMERIYSSIDKLIDLASKAHGNITRLDACTAAVGTYNILGELIMRTDMEPVIEYQEIQ